MGTPVLDVDLDADSITMLATRGLTAGAGEFVTFSSLDWVNDPSGEIVGFELENGGVTGLDAGDITTTAHTVEFDFNGTGWNPGDFVKITLQVDHDVPVPEPASVALLGPEPAGIRDQTKADAILVDMHLGISARTPASCRGF